MLITPSPAISELLVREVGVIPVGWWDNTTAQLSGIAKEETAWACLSRVLDNVLFRDPLPSEVRVGRELVNLAVPPAVWDAIQEELGMNIPGARRIIANFVGMIVHRAKVGAPLVGPVPPMVLGLALLLSDLARRSRRGRRAGGVSPPFAAEEPLRSCVKAVSGATHNERELVEGLLGWAGVLNANKKDAFRSAYHVLWLPLSRRVISEPLNPALETPLALPPNFLHDAIARPGENTTTTEASIRSDTVVEDGPAKMPLRRELRQAQIPSEIDVDRLIQVLAEPFLVMRGDPREAINAGLRGESPLPEDVLRSWRRAFSSGDLEVYGELGSVLQLNFPDSAWRVDAGPFAHSHKGSHGWFRVTRRGLRFRGLVLVAGLVVAVGAPKGTP